MISALWRRNVPGMMRSNETLETRSQLLDGAEPPGNIVSRGSGRERGGRDGRERRGEIEMGSEREMGDI